MQKKWYVATLILQCKVGIQDTGPWTCQEQIRLLKASSNIEAYQKASDLGEVEEHSYTNTYGETVVWEFIGIEDLEELSGNKIKDGVEIRTRIWKENYPLELVREKGDLTVYRAERNQNRIASEILLEEEASKHNNSS
jgi:hypothetical protein